MNIFVLDSNPEKAARFHNDRHVVKMILESCQLMATAHHELDSSEYIEMTIADMTVQAEIDLPLRPTHVNHPCAVWARQTDGNYGWLYDLCGALLNEFEQRYGKPHSYAAEVYPLLGVRPRNLWRGVRQPWAICMPDEYSKGVKHGSREAVKAYRRYYYGAKQHLAQWRAPATVPEWWQDMQRKERK